MELVQDRDNVQRQYSAAVNLCVVCALVVSLGFPGNMADILGDRISKLIEYMAFALEIGIMFMTSGDTWRNMKILDLKARYIPVYIFIIGIFAVSMIATRYVSAQLISCVRLIVTMFFAIWLQEYYDLESMIKVICTAQAVFVLLNLAFIVLFPSRSYESALTFSHALRGLYSTKNTFASELAYGIHNISILLWMQYSKRDIERKWIVLLAVQVLLILLCKATGSLVCMLISFAPLFLGKERRVNYGLWFCICSVAFLVASLNIMPRIAWIFEAIGKDATLTGRIPLWQRIINIMTQDRTLIGYGFGMFWRDERALALLHSGATTYFVKSVSTGAHNLILEMWLNTGLIGVMVLFLSMIISSMNYRKIQYSAYIYCCVLMLSMTINGLTERCIGSNYDFKILTLLLIMSIGCNVGDKNEIRYGNR